MIFGKTTSKIKVLLSKSFLNGEKLSWKAEIFLGMLVFFGFFGVPVLNIPIWLAVPVWLVSLISAGLLMFEGRSIAIGLKPFSKDPLGWRKAKKAYQSETDKQSPPDKREGS